MPKETIVFYTMQTSANGSCRRIMTELNKDEGNKKERAVWNVGHQLFLEGANFNVKWADVAADGYLVFANCPTELGEIRDLKGQNFIVNFRDPRDRLCNEFMWKLVHPKYPNEPQADIDARASHVLAKGIDSWIRDGVAPGPPGPKDSFASFMANVERIPSNSCHIQSYARLCLDFDSYLERAAAILGVELTAALKEKLEIERTDKLDLNPNWIGNKWQGSDILPGRYKRELKPETIAFLSEKYAPVLHAMALHDPDYTDLYLENVPKPAKIYPVSATALPASTRRRSGTASIGFVRHIITNRPDLRIDHFRNRSASQDVAFLFTSRAICDSDPSKQVTALLDKSIDVLLIAADAANAMPADDIADIERWLSWSSLPYRRRLGVAEGSDIADGFRFDHILDGPIDQMTELPAPTDAG